MGDILIPLCFGLGVIVHSVIMMRQKEDWIRLLVVSGISLFLAFMAEHQTLDSYIGGYFIAFCLCFAIAFKDKLLAGIDERTIITITLVFLYIMAIFRNVSFLNKIFLPSVFFSVIVLIIVITNLKNIWVRFFYYCWFVIMNIILIVIELSQGQFLDILKETTFQSYYFIDLFVLGYISLLLIANALYLFQVSPFALIPLKSHSYSEAYREWKKSIYEFIQKCSEEQLSPAIAIATIIIGSLIFYSNYLFSILSPILFINLAILGIDIFNKMVSSKRFQKSAYDQ